MEGVRRARAMCRGIGQSIDDLQLLDDRAGPSVIDDERQRIFMLRTNVNEVDVEPIDLGNELREGVQLRLARAPVVFCPPIARELLHRRERHALRLICDGFLLGPLRRGDAPAQAGDRFFGNVDAERAESKLGRCRCVGLVFHNRSPLCWYMTDWPRDGEARKPRTAPSLERMPTRSQASTSMSA